jgi:hypothetical protein
MIIGIELPGHWRAIDYAFDQERERSRPAYLLGMRAHAIAAAQGDKELFFLGGVEMPTLVYYSGIRSTFVMVPPVDFPNLALAEVVLHESDGALTTIGNIRDEWNVSGPVDERDLTVTPPGVCPSSGQKRMPNGLSVLAETQ